MRSSKTETHSKGTLGGLRMQPSAWTLTWVSTWVTMTLQDLVRTYIRP